MSTDGDAAGEGVVSDDTTANFNVLSLSDAERVDAACDRFETAWRSGESPSIEAYVEDLGEPGRTILLHELVKREVELRRGVGEKPAAAEYRLRFPDHARAIDRVFQRERASVEGESTFTHKERAIGADAASPTGSTTDAASGQLVHRVEVDEALGRIVGDYLIMDRIGTGAMGVVYRALQRTARRVVALKLIRADWCGMGTEASNREAELRFANEAQAHAQLEHDHIVPLYDAGHEGGLLYFSMRLIKGKSLRQVLRSDGPLPPRRAAYYMEAVARAIQYAHARGILHRDLKPSNIMVDENDRPYVIDLGLAKSLEATEYSTLSGRPLGTPEFMSPEQARGQRDMNFATDVWGLGATLFALLAGRPPFGDGHEPQVAVLRKVIEEEPRWPRERNQAVGRELKAICLKCLEKDPNKRFQSAGDLAGALNKYLNYENTGVTLPGPWTLLVKWVRRQPWRAVAAGIALLTVMVLASAWAWAANHSRTVAASLVRDMQVVPFSLLPHKIEQMATYRRWVNPRLHELLRRDPADAKLRTRVALALLPSESSWTAELVEELLICDPEEHQVIREALRERWPAVAPTLRGTLVALRSDANKRTRAATALIAFDGAPNPVDREAWTALRHASDPTPRVELLDWLVRTRVDIELLCECLERERDPSIQAQVVQALGARGEGGPPAGISTGRAPRLVSLYRDHPDAAIHSSLAYLLRRWGLEAEINRIDAELAGQPHGQRNWYVNRAGITMSVVLVTVDDRSPPALPRQRAYRIAVATTETPLVLFQEFDKEHEARRRREYGTELPAIPEAPADALNYFEAAAFCNWLSEREQIPPDQWSYLPGKSKGVWVLAPDYRRRAGYRLPTSPEWEYLARAGTGTDRYFGRGLAHLDDYAWHRGNSRGHPESVGRLRPNDFGLFDVIGNVIEWCSNPNPSSHPRCEFCPSGQPSTSCEVRYETLRGAAFSLHPSFQSVENDSAFRDVFESTPPANRWVYSGFRVVKNDP
jgi:hypothetical protein